MSICVSLGIFYEFVPTESKIKKDEDEKLLPEEHLCHMRNHLVVSLDQSKYQLKLDNPAERKRNDIWWVDPDGENVEDVIGDIKRQFLNNGLKWFHYLSKIETVLKEVEKEKACFNKFFRAKYFAERLGDKAKLSKYTELLRTESERLSQL